MEAVGKSCLSSIVIAPLDNYLSSMNRIYAINNFRVSKKKNFNSNRVCCKLPESEIGEKSTINRPLNSKNKMEDYNTAMKKMMRNPYEYHHDLGQSPFNLVTSLLEFQSQFQHLLIFYFIFLVII